MTRLCITRRIRRECVPHWPTFIPLVGCSRRTKPPWWKETSVGKPHTASSSSQYVLNAIKYIQFNYSHDISIDDVAKSVGVSRSHLYRVFMLNVGKSPIDYLTEYRINEACKLLRAGNLSIAEVAVSVGFFDQFYFSRVFKRAKGVPPSKYFAAQADAPADGTDHQ